MTEYISPLSLWLVVRKRFYKSGVFVEPAWTGSHEPKIQGPVLFVSRVHAEVYAHMRNKYHSKDDSANWKIISLSDFDLLEHAHGIDGKLYCQLAFGFSMADENSMLVATGAPRVRYVPLPFDIPKKEKKITFSFNQWAFDFMNEEWASIGSSEFDKSLALVDDMSEAEASRVAKEAIAKINVGRTETGKDLWGAYDSVKESWIVGSETLYHDKSLH
ncbi:hypothetical protein F7R25_04035 [Burkholderia stagnalis]|uniref:Uncharacterized protein n=1 Tax=Burkholderia stagnalis TaxID=1503054 RepID=A0A6L3N416_9BURK|nr:hypothetical protein [Burkholderia stagnalis]KAB0640674.1 hypothetical protein F7R25_04035 [Burkholderia stagnalis]VWB06359.1 hypothetical protein BST28156_00116 [Burkholderia stagnalis]